MQDLGFDMNDISAKLVHNITKSYDSAKYLPHHSAEFKKIVQPSSATNILCVMEAVENFLIDHDLDWLLMVPGGDLSKWKNVIQKL